MHNHYNQSKWGHLVYNLQQQRQQQQQQQQKDKKSGYRVIYKKRKEKKRKSDSEVTARKMNVIGYESEKGCH